MDEVGVVVGGQYTVVGIFQGDGDDKGVTLRTAVVEGHLGDVARARCLVTGDGGAAVRLGFPRGFHTATDGA